MAATFSKTPVSILQEHTVATGQYIPIYKLVKNGEGTHNPEFVFQVEVGPFCELGSGRSKQEAKHRAAKNMLKNFNLIDGETVGSDTNLNELNENYVGELKQYCIDNHYPEVKYDVEEEAGPPHCKVFKMVCHVSQLTDFGIAKTKKQAKHQAAYKMLMRLKNFKNEKTCDVTDSCSFEAPKPKIIQHVPEIKLTEEEVIEKLKAVRSLGDQEEKDPAAYYKDYQKAYLKLPEKSPTLSQLLKSDTIQTRDFLNYVKEIAKELEVDLTCTEVPTENDENYIILKMTTVPPLAALGTSIQNASFNLLKSLTDLCS